MTRRIARPLPGLLALLLAVLCGAGCRGERAVPAPPPAFRGDLVGSPLPPLDVKAWVVQHGPPPSASRGRPMILLFWNYQDQASMQALDLVAKLARDHAAQGLQAVTIHTEIGAEEFQSSQGVRAKLEERGIDLPSAIDRGTATLAVCRVYEVPSLVFVDGRGIVRGVMANYRRSRDEAISAFVADTLLP